MSKNKKIVVAVTGASGAIYASTLLEKLSKLKLEVSVIFSEKAFEIWEYELGNTSWKNSSFKIYKNNDFYAPFASGSSTFETMIICPCSMGTLGRIAHGTSDDLIARAADVILKERRKLIIVPREAPYNLIHIRNMQSLTETGAIICPASPSFYAKPTTIQELITSITDRILILAGIELDDHYKWGYE